MLTLLKINNLALVEDLIWEVGAGLVGVTGETGAGKSVIVGALKIVLGERADRTLVRTGCDSCSVEAVFDLARPAEVNAVLTEAGLEPCEGDQLVIRRVIGKSGCKSGGNKQFVNCSPVTLGVLKGLGGFLVDLHGPHDHQSLLSRDRQLAMLDAYSAAEKDVADYRRAFDSWKALQTEYDELANSERANEQEIDLLKYQLAEIDDAEIRADEGDELERRYKLANNSSHLLEVAASINGSLTGDDGSILASLSELARQIRDLEKHDPDAAEFTSSFDTAVVELEELGHSLRSYTEGLELDPAALGALETRLDLLESLKRKYGNTLADVLAFRDEAETKLGRIEGRGKELQRLEKAIEKAITTRDRAAAKLSARRKRSAPKLAKAVAAHLRELGFNRACFEVSLAPLDAPLATGAEAAEFMFSPNPGEPPMPLRLIASSG
jgi:DNA repair protein RecN (Recombination protein N)